MSVWLPGSRLSQIVMQHPGCLPVLQRFGIRLGVGDMTVAEACGSLGIDARFFLAVLNTYLNDDFHPSDALWEESTVPLTEYLEKTDTWYEQVQLPNIRRHFAPLVASGRDTGNLSLLGRFFEGLKSELTGRIESDRRLLFPALRGEGAGLGEEEAARLLDVDFAIEEKVSDLESFFVIHLTGDYDANLCMAVVSAIFALGRDLRQNNRIRQRILRPLTRKTLGSCR
ncbi:MAG: helix-turn-helix transcriptional regulator [Muribaculaceae bacterium]|nr:helix-turn-helix transcriptional regulator [Muribaculaceae bacterium]